MAATRWTAGSGDWDTAANWSGGVPGAGDDAVFPQLSSLGTVSGSGAAASLSVTGTQGGMPMVAFTGSHAVGTLLVAGAAMVLDGGASLSAGSATVESVFHTGQFGDMAVSVGTAGVLRVAAGASLSAGTITLDGGELDLAGGVLASAVVAVAPDAAQVATAFSRGLTPGNVILQGGTLTGVLGGTGTLQLGDFGAASYAYGGVTADSPSFVLANAGSVLPGGLRFGSAHVALTGGQSVGAVLATSGSLSLGAGARVGPVTAATTGQCVIDATDQDLTVFAGVGELDLANGRGHATVIGAVVPGQLTPQQESITYLGVLSVSGGAGSVTVFAGNSRGAIYGGTAGGNLIVAGADLSAFPVLEFAGQFIHYNGLNPIGSGPVTIAGGGDGDLLVVTGTFDNVVAAGAGNETLTGSGASGSNVFFGGGGADVIVAGGGQDLVVAGAGAATISAGSGSAGLGGTAVFAGSGSDVILGGAGAGYVQAGSGSATLFTGAGAELLGVVAGQAGGSLVVSGFRAGTDHVAVRGYADAPAVASSGGNTVLGFSDNTRVTLLGVASLPGGVFV